MQRVPLRKTASECPPKLKVLVILNGICQKKKRFYSYILPALQENFEVEVSETKYPWHAAELAAISLTRNFDCILSAGGDGTLHQIVNGLLREDTTNALPTVGIIPLGSGNDFATTCQLTTSPSSIVGLLTDHKPVPTDVGKISCLDNNGDKIQKYFINACSVGMGPATVMNMENKPKWIGANFRYLSSIIQTFFSHKPEFFDIRSVEWNWNGRARVFAMANGKSFGNKIYLAPNAVLDDGLFDSFLTDDLSLLQFLYYLQAIKGKKKVSSRHIFYSTGSWFEVRSLQPARIEAEGELVGQLPARIEMASRKIRILR
jgi:diacylglycerol kinase (ATP)